MRFPLIPYKIFGVVIFGLLFLLAGNGKMMAQISNERSLTFKVEADTILLDSLSLIPGSFELRCGSVIVDRTSYTLNEMKAWIVINDSISCDSVSCSFRVFPFNFGKEVTHKSKTMINTTEVSNYSPYVIGGQSSGASIFDDRGLQKSGSVSRGILFGNNQNLSVNSTLNLQLSGKISEQYSILASVTDDNIPIQPDGNSQQLQDFDQVFIQVYDDNTKLIAGDFQLRRPTGYFMNYFKRAQGAYFLHSTKPASNAKNAGKWTTEASASISKGRFARNVIQGIEGNQGPYRLRGTDNELFIIVLAGTEQVYIDGKLLQRGQDKDYVIDYNASEIVFTPKQFITKDRRIVVEFQYSEKRYARPLLQAAMSYERSGNKFFLNVYSENDAKNQPLQQDLSQSDREILASSGDSFLSAYKSGIDSVAYTNSAVLYELRDSLGFDSVFVFSSDSALAHYRISFTFVGNGNGDYVEDGFTSNGKKYRWVSPLLISEVLVHQGNYAPILLLAPPKKNQMISTGTELNFGSRNQSRISIEGAMSNKDLNTFSSLDTQDDLGFAFKTKYSWKKQAIQIDSTSKPEWNAELGYEYTGQYFNAIERFREVEFTRNWNAQQLNLNADQHISSGTFGFKAKDFGSVNLGADMFLIGESYTGYKVRLQTNIVTKRKWTVISNGSLLETRGQVNSTFLRHKLNVVKEIGKVRAYFKDEHENNLFYIGNTDSLSTTTYRFYDYEVGAGTSDTSTKSLTVYYRDRFDWKPKTGDLTTAAKADQYGLVFGLRGKKESRLNLNVSNRRLRVVDPELFTQAPENTLLTRVEYSFKLKNGFIQNTSFYEINSGLEQRREFIYLEVPAGQGVYVWNDYNGDGIKELNEFEVAQFSYEANYVRSFVQGNDYMKTFGNQFNQTLSLNPARILKKDKPLHKAIGRFSSTTSLRIDRKTTRENRNERFNPFINTIADSALLSLNGLFRNALFFNKSNPTFGMDYTFQYGRNKNLLSNGFESRGDDYNQVGTRWNFYRSFTLFIEGRMGKKGASSDFLSGRNYELNYFSVQPKFTWQPNNTGRLNITSMLVKKQNRLGEESVEIQKIGADFTISSIEKGSIQVEVNYYNIAYNGQSNNSLSFEMLEGLANGNNFTWSAGIQRTVAKNLQININYNGRKPEAVKTIHSGGVQIRALF